jgi:hypothetical protein
MQLHVMRSAQELSDLGNTYKKRLHPVTVTPRVTKTLIKVINKKLGAVTRLNQKAEIKNKVSDSNYHEINLNNLFEWNSKFRSSFDEN